MYKKLVYLNNKDVWAFNLYKKEREDTYEIFI